MRIYRHMTANDVQLEAFPFKRELSMEAYLIDNGGVLALDDDVFGNVDIVAAEVPLLQGRAGNGTDGRIDILATYSEEYIAIVELKLGQLDQACLNQLEDYLAARIQLLAQYPDILSTDSAPDPKWIGVLVGASIEPALAEKLRDGYQIGGRIPVAALTLQRFRGSDGSVFVTTDSYFRQLTSKDTTKYLFEGKTLGKGRLVLAVIKRFVELNPGVTFAQLEQAFPRKLQGSSGVIATADQANTIYANDGRRRHFLNPNDLVELRDGPAAVSSQWGIGNIGRFLARGAELGFVVYPVVA